MKEATHPADYTKARSGIHGWRRYKGWAIALIGIGAFLVVWANRPTPNDAPETSEHYYEVEGMDSCGCGVNTVGTGYVPVKLYRRFLDDSGHPSPAAIHNSSWHIIMRDTILQS